MNKNINYIINYSEGRLSKRKMKEFESALYTDKGLRQDFDVFNRINEIMRAKADLDEVRNDPALTEVDPLIKLMLSDYRKKPEKSPEAVNFIKDALEPQGLNRKYLNEEILEVEREIEELEIDQITEGWVKEYLEKKQNQTIRDPHTEEIRNFIKQSLKPEKKNSVLRIVHSVKGEWEKSSKLRVTALIAASMIAGAVLIRTLSPSDSPSALYAEFHKPMSIISPVTRGFNTGTSQKSGLAIEMYTQGNYTEAASMFDDIMKQNPALMSTYFYQGITQMELGNYSQAISRLSFVTYHPLEYTKEAQWYLGLCYLKTGEKAKAIPYFEILAESEGYYKDQADNLLRRLK